MNNKVKSIIIALLISNTFAFSTLLFQENFNYTAGDLLTSHGQYKYSTDSLPTLNIVSPGLSFPGYKSSGIGNAVKIDTTGEDVENYFSTQSSGAVYTSFVVKVEKAETTGDYFFGHIGYGNIFNSRVYIQDSVGDFKFGLSKFKETPTYTGIYNYDSTYIVVVKYEFFTGDTNDEVSLFVFDQSSYPLPVNEPITPNIGPLAPGDSDAVYFNNIVLRQGNDADAPRLILDGIRIGPSWADIFPRAPVLIKPVNDSILTNPDTVKFSWYAVADADSYNIIVNKNYGWEQYESMPPLPPIPSPLKQHIKDGGAMVGISNAKSNSVLYAFRGTKTNNFKKYIIGVSSGEWSDVASIPFGYKYPSNSLIVNNKFPGKGAAVCFDGDHTIYAVKGNSTQQFWVYDVNSDTWITKPDFPYCKLKGGTSLAYKNGKVYLLAGGAKNADAYNFFMYDTLNNTWEILANAPPGLNSKKWKDGSCLTAFGDAIYALKGGDKYNAFYKYDSMWSEKESIPQRHPQILKKKTKVKDGGAVTNDGEYLYAIKGGGINEFWRYTPGQEAVWTPCDTIPRLHNKSTPKTGAALAYALNKIWLLKGNKTPEIWAYSKPDEISDGSTTVIDDNTVNTDATTTELGEGSYCWKVGSFEGDDLSEYSEEWKFEIVEDVKTGKLYPTIVPTFVSKTVTLTSNINFEIAPNPFTKLTTINYSVPISGKVTISLYNSTGRLVNTLINENKRPGSYSLIIDNCKLKIPRGVYFLKYETGNNKSELKLIVE